MLILTRRIGEALMIGDEVNITVLGVKGNQSALALMHHYPFPVHREEIYLKLKKRKSRVVLYKTYTC